jgi:nitric oxide reductase NorD protein
MDITAPLGGRAEDDAPGPDASAKFYDEWDGRAYRPGYCRVVLERAKDPAPGSAGIVVPAERVRRVRRVFEALEDARRLRNRQVQGSEVDVDSVIARYATVRAGKEGDHRLYAARRPVEHDVATLLLLDVSSSSDGWLAGRHVIALEREAAACVGDALAEMRSAFAIAGFYSHTHNDCRFVQVKSFAEPWRAARGRLGTIEPQGYTRIGPAIRHATAWLARVQARRRALLIVTDGRPTDYDQYEGRYGIEDVRRALDEAARSGVTPFSLCIANDRASHLRAMFGASGYEVVSAPEDLAEKLIVAQHRFRAGGR